MDVPDWVVENNARRSLRSAWRAYEDPNPTNKAVLRLAQSRYHETMNRLVR